MGADEKGSISAGEFGTAFKGFLEQAAAQAPVEEPFFIRRLTEFFGNGDQLQYPIVLQEFPNRDQPNLQRALDGYLGANGRRAEFLGALTANKSFNGISLQELVVRRGRPGLWGDGSPTPGPVEYVDVAIGEDETLTCMKSGLILVEDGAQRLVVLVSPATDRSAATSCASRSWRKAAKLPRSASRSLPRRARTHRLSGASSHRSRSSISRLRSRCIALAAVERTTSSSRAVCVLERIERHTIDFAGHLGPPQAAGQHAKRGLLLHGPPGDRQRHSPPSTSLVAWPIELQSVADRPVDEADRAGMQHRAAVNLLQR